jgi:hypothetical protein
VSRFEISPVARQTYFDKQNSYYTQDDVEQALKEAVHPYTQPASNPIDNGSLILWNPSTNKWEASEKLRHHLWAPIGDYYTTSTNGTTTLTSTNNFLNFFTGTATGHKIILPDATTLENGWKYELNNSSNQTINVYLNDGTTLLYQLAQNSMGTCTLQSNSTTNGVWVGWQVLQSSTASGIISYNIISSTPFITTSLTDVLITGFTLTPQAGTYGIWYSASVLYNTTPKAHWWSIYKDGSKITDSERQQDTAHSNQVMMDSTQTITQVNGSQAIDVRVRCSTSNPTEGQLTVNGRSLLLIRLGT